MPDPRSATENNPDVSAGPANQTFMTVGRLLFETSWIGEVLPQVGTRQQNVVQRRI